MTQTILVTFEKVLQWHGCGGIASGAGRAHRTNYMFPNGSEVAVLGFDDPERIKSSDFDIAYINEGTEVTPEDWEITTTRLRHGKMPFQQGIIDCNPGEPNHWLNIRTNAGKMRRILSPHEDNPRWHDSKDWTAEGKTYLARLTRMTGARKARLLYGLWAAAEGAVFEEVWDEARHRIDPVDPETIRGHIAAVDWGYRDPGVIQVWGLDGDKRMYRVREIYQSAKTLDWWIRQAKCLRRDYPDMAAFICDPSGKSQIESFIQAGLPAFSADRTSLKPSFLTAAPPTGSIQVGLQMVESRLRDHGDGKPGMFFCKNSLGWYDDSGVWTPGRDEALAEAGHPVCTEDEFPVYAYPKSEDGKPIKETPVDMF